MSTGINLTIIFWGNLKYIFKAGITSLNKVRNSAVQLKSSLARLRVTYTTNARTRHVHLTNKYYRWLEKSDFSPWRKLKIASHPPPTCPSGRRRDWTRSPPPGSCHRPRFPRRSSSSGWNPARSTNKVERLRSAFKCLHSNLQCRHFRHSSLWSYSWNREVFGKKVVFGRGVILIAEKKLHNAWTLKSTGFSWGRRTL